MTISVPTALGLIWSVGVPLLWLLGVEQLAWVIASLGILAAVLVWGRLRIPRAARPVAALWGLFLLAVILAGVQINQGSRIISFARDLSVYGSCLVVFVLAVSSARMPGATQTFAWHLAAFFLIANLASFTYVLFGSWTLQSLLANLVPNEIASTTTGHRMINKMVAINQGFFGLIGVRIRGLFFSSIQYASAMLLALPVLAWLFRYHRRGRALATLALITGVLGIFYAQSRSALGVLLVLPVIHAFSGTALRSGSLISARVVALIGTITATAVGIGIYMWPLIVDTFQTVFILERMGSFLERMDVYRATFAGIVERPLTGWGTQRDMPGLLFPAGSHNWPLGIVYKYGLVGFIPWITMIILMLRSILRMPDPDYEGPADQGFRRAVGTGFLAYLAVAMTLEPIVDAISIHTFAALAGFAVGRSAWAAEEDPALARTAEPVVTPLSPGALPEGASVAGVHG